MVALEATIFYALVALLVGGGICQSDVKHQGTPWNPSKSNEKLRVTFDCRGKTGYFPDSAYECEVFHYCKPDGDRNTFRCPANSRFDHLSMTCEEATPSNAKLCREGSAKQSDPDLTWTAAPQRKHKRTGRVLELTTSDKKAVRSHVTARSPTESPPNLDEMGTVLPNTTATITFGTERTRPRDPRKRKRFHARRRKTHKVVAVETTTMPFVEEHGENHHRVPSKKDNSHDSETEVSERQGDLKAWHGFTKPDKVEPYTLPPLPFENDETLNPTTERTRTAKDRKEHHHSDQLEDKINDSNMEHSTFHRDNSNQEEYLSIKDAEKSHPEYKSKKRKYKKKTKHPIRTYEETTETPMDELGDLEENPFRVTKPYIGAYHTDVKELEEFEEQRWKIPEDRVTVGSTFKTTETPQKKPPSKQTSAQKQLSKLMNDFFNSGHAQEKPKDDFLPDYRIPDEDIYHEPESEEEDLPPELLEVVELLAGTSRKKVLKLDGPVTEDHVEKILTDESEPVEDEITEMARVAKFASTRLMPLLKHITTTKKPAVLQKVVPIKVIYRPRPTPRMRIVRSHLPTPNFQIIRNGRMTASSQKIQLRQPAVVIHPPSLYPPHPPRGYRFHRIRRKRSIGRLRRQLNRPTFFPFAGSTFPRFDPKFVPKLTPFKNLFNNRRNPFYRGTPLASRPTPIIHPRPPTVSHVTRGGHRAVLVEEIPLPVALTAPSPSLIRPSHSVRRPTKLFPGIPNHEFRNYPVPYAPPVQYSQPAPPPLPPTFTSAGQMFALGVTNKPLVPPSLPIKKTPFVHSYPNFAYFGGTQTALPVAGRLMYSGYKPPQTTPRSPSKLIQTTPKSFNNKIPRKTGPPKNEPTVPPKRNRPKPIDFYTEKPRPSSSPTRKRRPNRRRRPKPRTTTPSSIISPTPPPPEQIPPPPSDHTSQPFEQKERKNSRPSSGYYNQDQLGQLLESRNPFREEVSFASAESGEEPAFGTRLRSKKKLSQSSQRKEVRTRPNRKLELPFKEKPPMSERPQLPRIEEKARPQSLEENLRPPRLEEYKQERPRPPRLEEYKQERPRPPRLEEYKQERPRPPRLEEYKQERPRPPRLEEYKQERPQPARLEERQRPTRIEEYKQERPQPARLEERQRPTRIEEYKQEKPRPPRLEVYKQERPYPPRLEEKLQAPKEEENSRPTKVEERQRPPKRRRPPPSKSVGRPRPGENFFSVPKGLLGSEGNRATGPTDMFGISHPSMDGMKIELRPQGAPKESNFFSVPPHIERQQQSALHSLNDVRAVPESAKDFFTAPEGAQPDTSPPPPQRPSKKPRRRKIKTTKIPNTITSTTHSEDKTLPELPKSILDGKIAIDKLNATISTSVSVSGALPSSETKTKRVFSSKNGGLAVVRKGPKRKKNKQRDEENDFSTDAKYEIAASVLDIIKATADSERKQRESPILHERN